MSANKFYINFLSLTVVIYPLFNGIKIIGEIVSIGDIILFLMIILTILFGKINKLKLDTSISSILIFFMLIVLISLITFMVVDTSIIESMYRIVRLSFYILGILIIYNFADYKDIVSKMYKISVFAAVILIVQIVLYETIAYELNIVILGATVGGSYFENSLLSVYRPSSIFLEPAYFTVYLIVPILYNLITCDGKYRLYLKNNIILILSCLATTSTYAFGLIGVSIFIFTVQFFYMKKKLKVKYLYMGLSILLTLFVIICSVNSAIIDYVLFKILTIADSARGTFAFMDSSIVSIINPMIGVGIGNEQSYFLLRGITIGYQNSISLVFLYSGYLGLFGCFIYFLTVIFYKLDYGNIYFSITYICLCLFSSAMFDFSIVMFIVLSFYRFKIKNSR